MQLDEANVHTFFYYHDKKRNVCLQRIRKEEIYDPLPPFPLFNRKADGETTVTEIALLSLSPFSHKRK